MILGLDVSTSITGVCLLDDEGLFVWADHVTLKKFDSFHEKCVEIHRFLMEDLDRRDVSHVFVEDRLGGFTRGFTNQGTMMTLAAFNSVVSYVACIATGVVPVHIHPSTIKATMKRDGLIISKGTSGKDRKTQIHKWVVDNVPGFPNERTRTGTPKPHCFDIADAYCVARAGYLAGE